MNIFAHCIKYILFISNLVFLLCGILLIVFGSLSLSSLKDFSDFANSGSTSTIPICILILGCIIFVVSFFGCCGAIKDNRCLINTYCICMLILVILQFVLIGYVWIRKGAILNNIESIVDKIWDNLQDKPGFMDSIQITYKCCGKNGSYDYAIIPNSCCGSLNQVCSPLEAEQLPGCKLRIKEFWASNTSIIKYAGLGVAAFELITLALAWFLSSSIKVSRRNKTTY